MPSFLLPVPRKGGFVPSWKSRSDNERLDHALRSAWHGPVSRAASSWMRRHPEQAKIAEDASRVIERARPSARGGVCPTRT